MKQSFITLGCLCAGFYTTAVRFNASQHVLPYGFGTLEEPYTKLHGIQEFAGMVCIVAGASGQIDASAALNHPANVPIGTSGKNGAAVAGTVTVLLTEAHLVVHCGSDSVPLGICTFIQFLLFRCITMLSNTCYAAHSLPPVTLVFATP
jgi:hypothetical protein